MSQETKISTGKVRFSYAKVFTPTAMNEGDQEKYSVQLIIRKDDEFTVNRVKAAIKAALELGKASKFGGKVPKGYKNPLRDGDEEREDAVYEGCYFLNASSTRKPNVVGRDLQPIMDADEFYSGCFGRANVNFYPFNYNGTKGIAVGLNSLMKLSEGERLGGDFSSPEQDFGDDYSYDDELM